MNDFLQHTSLSGGFLDIWGLHKSFGNNHVLKGVDLSVKKGEKIAIIGASGSGKSTILRCINHLEEPTDGIIMFNNMAITKQNLTEMRKKIGFVFQSFNLFANMTVLKNVTIAPKLHGRKEAKSQIELKALALLERFGLLEKAHAYPSSLSGGQKQRVAIVRALMNDPEIMLFDEPTSALDPEMVKEVLEVIKELADSGMTMMIVTHEMKFAKNIADKIIFIHEGKIEECAPPDEFFDNPKSERLQTFLSKVLD